MPDEQVGGLINDIAKSNKSVITNPFVNAPKENIKSINFDPNSKDYEHIINPTPFSDVDLGYANQGFIEGVSRTVKNFGASFASGFGQGLANLLDVSSWGNDNYQSKLFGVTTKEMQDWANNISQENRIYEKNPGKFSLSDPGWWMNQVSSAGTGLGMGVFALAETAGIELATGGLGTEVAIARLGNTISKIRKATTGAETIAEAMAATKSLRSAAMVYAGFNRINESRMEAMQTYDDISNKLSAEKDDKGNFKYTPEQVKEFASKGADKTWGINMALLPLDILAYRTMVFNPISGTGEGLLEKGLTKVASKFGTSKLGKAAGWLTTKGIGVLGEGVEEGFQYVAQEEGKHYADVLGGLKDSSTFMGRLGKDVTTDEFWNNFAGGIIGSPIIGIGMSALNKGLNFRKEKAFNDMYNNHITNIGKMDNTLAKNIRDLEEQGKTKEANVARRQFGINKALSSLHFDAMKDSDTSFNAYKTFLEGTLEEVNKGNIDTLHDLGFSNPSDEQIEHVKNEFASYINDADELKNIYDKVKHQYNKQFVPSITYDNFRLNELIKEKDKLESDIPSILGNISQYNSLSNFGKDIHSAEYSLRALKLEESRLTDLFKTSDNKEEVSTLLDNVRKKVSDIKTKLDSTNIDDAYTADMKSNDKLALDSMLEEPKYMQVKYDRERLDNEILSLRKSLSKWNNPSYIESRLKDSVNKATTVEQLESTKDELEKNGKLDSELAETIVNKQKEILAKDLASNIDTTTSDSTKSQSLDESGIPMEKATSVPGNANLFETAINDIKTVADSMDNTFNEKDNREAEILLSPSTINNSKFSKENQDKIKSATASMLSQLGNTATFEDLVRAFISQTDKTIGDKHFNLLVEGWKLVGKPLANFDATYNKIFTNPIDDFLRVGEEVLDNSNEDSKVFTANVEVENKVLDKEIGTPSITSNNEVVYQYNGLTTNNEKPKLATSFRLHKANIKNDNNVLSTEYEYTEQGLNEGDYVNSKPLLSFDEFTVGTSLEIRVPPNFMDIQVPVYDENGIGSKSMKFAEYIALNKLTPDMQEYKDKIPMIAYHSKYDKGLAFVHDIGWYHPLRFLNTEVDKMNKAIESTRGVREAVLGYTKPTTENLIKDLGKENYLFTHVTTEANAKSISQGGMSISVGTGISSTLTFLNSDNVLSQINRLNNGEVVHRDTNNNSLAIIAVPRQELDKIQGKDISEKFENWLVENNKINNRGQYAIPTQFNVGYLSNKEIITNKQDNSNKNVGKSISIVITQNKLSSFEPFRTLNRGTRENPDYEFISFNEANPDAIFAVADSSDKLKDNELFNNNDSVIIRNNPFKQGYVYDIRRVGKQEDKKTFIAFEVSPQKISNEVKTTVTQAINIFLNKTNDNKSVRALHDETIKTIKDTTGLDISNPNDLINYLRQFILVYGSNDDFDNVKDNKDVDAIINSKNNADKNLGYIVVQRGGSVYIGGKKVSQIVSGNPVQTIYSNSNKYNQVATDIFIKTLNKKYLPTINKDGSKGVDVSILDTMKNNYHTYSATKNKPVVMINADGKANTVANSYRNYIMNTFKTNIKSENISKEGEKPVYVCATHMISYELANTPKAIQTPTIEDVIPNPIQVVANDDFVNEIVNKVQKDLGIDIENFDEDLYSPSTIDAETRKKVFNSLNNRVGELTQQENNQLNDFIFNQIIPILDEKNYITKKELSEKVNVVFNEFLNPLKNYYSSEALKLKSEINANPNIDIRVIRAEQIYSKEANRINEVQNSNNFNSLVNEAWDRVIDNLGVKELKTDDTSEEVDGDSQYSSLEDKEAWQIDSLSIDPNAKTSAALRRFYSSIPILDTNGDIKKGVFGLPLYYNKEDIGMLAKAILTNTPSDLNTMIDKLSIHTQYTWVNQLIDKLKTASNQIQKQFVSDMSMSSLKMKFCMMVFDKRTETYKTKVWDANQGGITEQILSNWHNNFESSNLLKFSDDNITLNKDLARQLLNTYNSWTGEGIDILKSSIYNYSLQLKTIRKDNSIKISPTVGTDLYNELSQLSIGDKRKIITSSSTQYILTKSDNNTYTIGHSNTSLPTEIEIKDWLYNFGIDLSSGALNELYTKGLYHNYNPMKFNQLFDTGGLFKTMANALSYSIEKGGEYSFEEFGKNPLDEGVVKSLAALEYKYNNNIIPTGGYMNGKNFYPITQNKFATERATELTNKESKIREQLSKLSFSKNSYVLQLLNTADKNGEYYFRDKFELAHVAFDAIKILGKSDNKDSAINKLSSLDYEIASLGMFWDMSQSKKLFYYPGTEIPMRIATMLMPTMSDKQTGLWLRTGVLNLDNSHFIGANKINDNIKDVLYQQVVKPELERMLSFSKIGKTNIKSYDDGATIFNFIPKLNTIEFVQGLTLTEAIKSKDLGPKLSLEMIESNKDLMSKIKETIAETVYSLAEEKRSSWETDGIISLDKEGKVDNTKFIDSNYLSNSGKFSGSLDEQVSMAILDTVVNQMMHLSNSFMLFAGDPALYYKKDGSTKSNDYTQIVKDTFVNVGKRLANQIAPGIKLAQSENEQYLQVFINDRKSISDINFIKYVTSILDGNSISNDDYNFIVEYLGKSKNDISVEDKNRFSSIKDRYSNAAGFFEIEGSDAQEYTTWQEHLNILEKLGRVPDNIINISISDIAEARKLFNSNKSKADLTSRDKELIGIVMQPIKPVYTGQIYDEAQDVMRTMYIKSSSFPLIPQLTEGFELDKLRVSLEKLQKEKNLFVRASYQTANKVGALKSAVDLWNNKGLAIDDNISSDNLFKSSLVLNRKDFRIQQDVPFKSKKNLEDKVTMGTQLMKLLFGNDIINYDGFSYQGRDNWTGLELHREFSELHKNLIELKKQQLFDELGLDTNGNAKDIVATTSKVQELLFKEANDRGFPKQVLDGLELQDNGDFTLPLWSSISSNKFESLLNAIIVNRLSRIKFPGNSYVAGSPEGFITKKENEVPITQSQMVYTNSWDGDSLKASYSEDNKIKKVQVFVSSKFRDTDGNIINLLDDEWSTVDSKGIRRINQDNFDSKLFNLTSFRIPTTGISSASQIEIVGFLPYTNADLMILPSNLTKQKGLDFDIDKENTYQYWHTLTNEGRFEVLDEKHRTSLLSKEDKLADGGFLNNIVDKLKIDYTDEEISEDDKLRKKNNELNTKFIQNKILEIYESILSNPDSRIQSKINGVLNTDYSESEALFIENMKPQNNENWTPLSGEYQKQKMSLGAGGKIGTGAYSMDVVFHSLVQQAKATGNPLKLMKMEEEYDEITQKHSTSVVPLVWRFGKENEGGIVSKGELGLSKTLDGTRTTSDLLNEAAQTAVDNEKLQIMGKVNLNELTLDVHKVFNLLGIDKFNTDSKHSISFLFMSQPIIREYVLKLSNSKSVLSEFEKDKKNKIIQELKDKYYSEYENDVVKGIIDNEVFSDLMTENNMINAIKSATPEVDYGKLQFGILNRFLEMEKYGLAIRGIQTTLNVESKGLGKSFFDVINKRTKLENLGKNSPIIGDDGLPIGKITNISSLVGEYRSIPAVAEELKDLQSQGFYQLGNTLVKPTTYVGSFNIITTNVAYNTWKDLLPYDSHILDIISSEILPIIENQNTQNDTRTIENKQLIFSEFKKYLTTLTSAGFIGKQDDINEERKRLYLDTDDNTSLPKYLSELTKRSSKVIDNFIKSNKLINSFEYKINKGNKPSLIKFNNTKGESWNEHYLYEELASLLEARGKLGSIELPEIGNKKYTLDTLAQDIINYAMLGNAKQEAIQFTKYIPVQYMNLVGYSAMMRNIHNKLNGKASDESINKFIGALGFVPKVENTLHVMSEFTTQFIQHNPELVKYTLDAKKDAKLFINKGNNTYILNSDDKPNFIKIYDQSVRDEKKFRLFKFNGESYNQIPLLGVFGMDEYQFGNVVGDSIVNYNKYGKVENNLEPTSTPIVDNETYGVGELKAQEIISNISKDTTSKFSKLAELLLPYINNNKVIINNTIVKNGKPFTDFNGAYTPKNSNITINPKIFNNKDLLAETMLHEVIHSITHNKVKPFIDIENDGRVTLRKNAPNYIQDIVSIFNYVRVGVPKSQIDAFIHNIDNATDEEKSAMYGYTDIYEFMSMALTDKGFQEILNKIEYRQSGKSILDKFKDLVKSILNSLGVNFDENYTAAHAISTIFGVIKQDTESNNPYQQLFDDSIKNDKIKVLNQEDINRFNNYLLKSNGIMPNEFFTSSSYFKEFYNNDRGSRGKAPQSSKWILNINNYYDLVDKESGEIYITNVDLRTGNKIVNNDDGFIDGDEKVQLSISTNEYPTIEFDIKNIECK